MNSFYIVMLIVAVVSFIGCREDRNRVFFDGVEAGVTENPDSVLTLLQEADTMRFASAADKARYHLLMAEARYKAGIDDTITDHVLPAVEYYKEHGSRNDAARAYFYSGLVKNNLRQYPGAAIDLLRAEKIAKVDNDTMRLALIYRALGDTFVDIHNWKNALSYHSKAQKYFEDAKAYNYSYHAYYDMARCYLALRNFPLAMKYALLSYKYGEDANDMPLKCVCMTMIADCYWYLKEYGKAYDTYIDIYDWGKDFMMYQDYYRLGMLHLHFGNVDQAREIEKKISVLNPDSKLLYTELMIHDKKYPEAINGLYHTIGQQNKALNESWSTNLATEIIKYEQNEEQIIIEARKRERILWVCIIALVALSLSLTIIVITRKNKLLSISRDADMEAISRLNDTVRKLASSKSEADQRHASEMENLRTSISDSRSIIRDLMASRFTEFSDLCQVYFQHEGHKNSQIKIYNEVKTLISKVSSDSKFMKAVEAKINASLNDLIKNFRQDFPNLNDWEYTLFMYNVCGIEPKIIALFLGLKPELIHKRKANLKRKIATSNTPLKDEYLSFLS